MNKVIFGFNDLATVNPELVAEWHPTKNGKLTPSDVSKGSDRKVWWLGSECRHEWQDTVSHRCSGRNCPVCSSESKTSFAEQAFVFYLNQLTPANNRYLHNGNIEIDIFLPDYNIGIEYDGQLWHQNAQKDLEKNRLCEQAGVRLVRIREPGCPSLPVESIVLPSLHHKDLKNAILQVCTILGKTVDVNIDRDRGQIYDLYIENIKQNSLAVLNPELAAEWHPTKNGSLLPSQVAAGSNKKVWWLGKCNHDWQESIAARNSNKLGCPYCSGHRIWKGFNDLATTHPELAAEWHPTKNGKLTPSDVSKGSVKKGLVAR